jgi:hypothetical protein
MDIQLHRLHTINTVRERLSTFVNNEDTLEQEDNKNTRK